jgi:hypothetical protein
LPLDPRYPDAVPLRDSKFGATLNVRSPVNGSRLKTLRSSLTPSWKAHTVSDSLGTFANVKAVTVSTFSGEVNEVLMNVGVAGADGEKAIGKANAKISILVIFPRKLI